MNMLKWYSGRKVELTYREPQERTGADGFYHTDRETAVVVDFHPGEVEVRRDGASDTRRIALDKIKALRPAR
jgi:hypothetical protein